MANSKFPLLNLPPEIIDLALKSMDRLELLSFNFSSVNLNRFIKLWRKGSNPRLAVLWMKYPSRTAPDVNVVLKGIPYHRTTADELKKRHDYYSEKWIDWFDDCLNFIETTELWP
ncbi:hypothetical protein L5515_013605 [Caenorhabditis briggsae]|uniref:F-box domain-containing protein n=1 Tax=Caenorhabditis briggsae TaxID=6238 RepID=A0AAE9EB31_CAEBR|nr:hypothetical protein L5515_013605 [Caenorhabditis briggsae]